MIFKNKLAGKRSQSDELRIMAELNSELDEALANFRLSVHAWSEAAFSRPRTTVAPVARRRVWRMALGWTLGCVLAAGGASAGIWQHHQRELEIRITQARVAQQQRLAAQQRNQRVRQEDEDLLAKVDRDVSREVPVAMEPLAQLMSDDVTP